MSGNVSLINGHIDDDTKVTTYKEAKALFEYNLKDGKCSDDCPDCNAMELAILALEKQIPKKPTKAYFEGGFVNYHCVCCGEAQGLTVNKRWQKYCPHCGQALNWSDTE